MSVKAVAVLVFLLCAAGAALALANAGGDEKPLPTTTARAEASEPLEIALKPAHRSGVSGTARLVQGASAMTVTVKLSERVSSTLLAHIHTGPCSEEPTWDNPRIWAGLTDLVDGRSKTEIQLATLAELRSEGASINVHDPDHNQRPLVCGDIAQR